MPNDCNQINKLRVLLERYVNIATQILSCKVDLVEVRRVTARIGPEYVFAFADVVGGSAMSFLW